MATILPVMEQFYTMQGEGAYSGHAAYFIRLGGCDVGCVWCDVKESWDADLHEKVTVEDIVLQAKQPDIFERRRRVVCHAYVQVKRGYH